MSEGIRRMPRMIDEWLVVIRYLDAKGVYSEYDKTYPTLAACERAVQKVLKVGLVICEEETEEPTRDGDPPAGHMAYEVYPPHRILSIYYFQRWTDGG